MAKRFIEWNYITEKLYVLTFEEYETGWMPLFDETDD